MTLTLASSMGTICPLKNAYLGIRSSWLLLFDYTRF